MADWLTISDAAVNPDAPVTSELAYGLRDNPIAIAEGASGAPRIVRGALSTATSSLSGNVPASGGMVEITMDAYSFFPIIIGTNLDMVAKTTGGGSGIGFNLRNNSVGATAYSVTWRYINA